MSRRPGTDGPAPPRRVRRHAARGGGPVGLALAAGLVAALALAPARAHDTWFTAQPTAGGVRLALGTGHHYPAHESPPGVVDEGAVACRPRTAGSGSGEGGADATGEARALVPRALPPTRRARSLQFEPVPVAPLSCAVQLPERQTTLSPRQQAAYLEEIRAAPALRAQARAWAEAGLPWQERYRKHARIELGGGAGVPQALPLGLDFVPEAGPWRAGGRVEVRLLRDGQALAGQPVQLRGSQAAAGFWLRTDADGRIVVPLPLAGPWMLRTVHLEPEAARPGHWLSRFATLVLEVEP
jgi:hypothetical protein